MPVIQRASEPQPFCVLVADDEDAVRRALVRLLTRAGLSTLEARSGAEAVKLLDSRDDIDVVISDISMPDMDGIELLRHLHEGAADVPVLLVTGAPQLESAVQAVQYGAFEYVMKPFDNARLLASVERAATQHRAALERNRTLDSAVRVKGASGPHSGRLEPITEGTILGHRYRVVSMLGSGGMGTVYEAVRIDLGNLPVAIKVLHPKLAERTDLVRRFRREAELIAAIEHPNIVRVFDFEMPPDGPAFFVMELLRGRTLAATIQRGTLSERRLAFIASQALDALGAAHARSIVHRDLKPENVFLTSMSGMNDIVRVLDFGIAKVTSESTENKLTEG